MNLEAVTEKYQVMKIWFKSKGEENKEMYDRKKRERKRIV